MIFSAVKKLHEHKPNKFTTYMVEQYHGDLSWCKFLETEDIYKLIKDVSKSEQKDNATNMIIFFKELGIDLNKTLGYKNLLMCAVEDNNLEVAKLLLENGSSPIAFTSNMCSPFFDAICAHPGDLPHKKEFLNLFTKYGANWDDDLPDRHSHSIGIHTFRDLLQSRGFNIDYTNTTISMDTLSDQSFKQKESKQDHDLTNIESIAILYRFDEPELLETVRKYLDYKIHFLGPKVSYDAIIIAVDCFDEGLSQTYTVLNHIIQKNGTPVIAGLILNTEDDELTELVEMEMESFFESMELDIPIVRIQDVNKLSEII